MSASRLAALLVLLTAPFASAQEMRRIDLGGGVSLELVRIPKGTFNQGSPPAEPNRANDEAPRKVTISHDFWMGRTEVTVGQFMRFVTATGYRTEAEKGESGGFGFENEKLVQNKKYTWRNPGFTQTVDHPVTIVTYTDAQTFLKWLAGVSGLACELPTEAQWEYACRAGSELPWPGAEKLAEVAELAWTKENAGNGTRPVAQKKPNAFGLFDLCGNVYEWCADFYGPYPAGAATDPVRDTPPEGEDQRRVLRGGSWLKAATSARSASRYRNTPGSRNADNGFRVVAATEPPPPPPAPPPAPPSPADLAGPISTEQTDAGSESGGTGRFVLICLACVGLPAAAVIALVVLLRRVRTLTPLTGGSRVSLGEDGFWVEGPGIRPGMTVAYRCRVNGSETDGEVPVTSARPFVYTGGTPSDVVITAIRGGGFSTGTGRSYRAVPPQPPVRPVVEDEPFRGFPPAY